MARVKKMWYFYYRVNHDIWNIHYAQQECKFPKSTKVYKKLEEMFNSTETDVTTFGFTDDQLDIDYTRFNKAEEKGNNYGASFGMGY